MPGKYHLFINDDGGYGPYGLYMKSKIVLMGQEAVACTLTPISETGQDTALCINSQITLDNVIISENYAYSGEAIYATDTSIVDKLNSNITYINSSWSIFHILSGSRLNIKNLLC